MKKIRKIISVLIVCILLSGCAKVNIDYKIDKNNTVSLSYTLEVDKNTLSHEHRTYFETYLVSLEINYGNKGFECEKVNGDIVNLVCTYTKETTSYEEAYNELISLINDPEVSIFLSSDITYLVEDYERVLDFNAMSNIDEIISSGSFTNLPTPIQTLIKEEIEKAEINFQMSLPETSVVSISDGVLSEASSNETIISYKIKTDSESDISFIARTSLNEDPDINKAIEKTERKLTIFTVLSYVGIVGAILAVAVIINIKRKEK